MNFNQVFAKNVIYDDIKSDKKQSFTLSSDSFCFFFWNIFLGLNFSLSFYWISNILFSLDKNELRKNC